MRKRWSNGSSKFWLTTIERFLSLLFDWLTLFLLHKGGISPYMSVTWPSLVGIGSNIRKAGFVALTFRYKSYHLHFHFSYYYFSLLSPIHRRESSGIYLLLAQFHSSLQLCSLQKIQLDGIVPNNKCALYSLSYISLYVF